MAETAIQRRPARRTPAQRKSASLRPQKRLGHRPLFGSTLSTRALGDANAHLVAAACVGVAIGFHVVPPLREVIDEHIRVTLARCGGNQTLAARRLEIGRSTLVRIMLRLRG